jgi:hypothetical protein
MSEHYFHAIYELRGRVQNFNLMSWKFIYSLVKAFRIQFLLFKLAQKKFYSPMKCPNIYIPKTLSFSVLKSLLFGLPRRAEQQ